MVVEALHEDVHTTSAATMRVALVPVGDVSERDFELYAASLRRFASLPIAELSLAPGEQQQQLPPPPLPESDLSERHTPVNSSSRFGNRRPSLGVGADGAVRTANIRLNLDTSAEPDEWADLQPFKEVLGVIGVCGQDDLGDQSCAHASLLQTVARHKFAHHCACYRLFVFSSQQALAGSEEQTMMRNVVMIPTSTSVEGLDHDDRLPLYLSTLMQIFVTQVNLHTQQQATRVSC